MPVVRLTGTLHCPPEDLDALRAALPGHVALTRAEPGCLSFELHEIRPGLFTVSERFADRAAFDAHQARMAASRWAAITARCHRDYKVIEA